MTNLTINGLLIDPALLRMIQNIEEQTLTQLISVGTVSVGFAVMSDL